MTKHTQRYETNDSKQVIEKVLAECNRIEWNERPTEAKHLTPMILSSTYSFNTVGSGPNYFFRSPSLGGGEWNSVICINSGFTLLII